MTNLIDGLQRVQEALNIALGWKPVGLVISQYTTNQACHVEDARELMDTLIEQAKGVEVDSATLEGLFRKEYMRRHLITYPLPAGANVTPEFVESVLSCGAAQVARTWFYHGYKASLPQPPKEG